MRSFLLNLYALSSGVSPAALKEVASVLRLIGPRKVLLQDDLVLLDEIVFITRVRKVAGEDTASFSVYFKTSPNTLQVVCTGQTCVTDAELVKNILSFLI